MNTIENTASNTAQTAALSELQLRLQQQKSAFACAPMPSLKECLQHFIYTQRRYAFGITACSKASCGL
ncbi:MAG: hypothetical protein VYB48_03980 [Pseudomonadota bacterium]|nr:hypothetical protein [Pseudomonadota bacterium]